MVVVHNYSNQKDLISNEFSEKIEIDDDKAYVIGIWAVSVLVILIIILLVIFAIIRTKNNEQIAKENIKKEQVLGEKQSEKSPTKTEVKIQDTTKNEDVQNLERPLTNDEIEAKAQKMPGSIVHTVAAGESLYTIGEKYNIDWHEIATASNLAPPYSLHVGQKLIIPKGG
jgi:LysM repeat protein